MEELGAPCATDARSLIHNACRRIQLASEEVNRMGGNKTILQKISDLGCSKRKHQKFCNGEKNPLVRLSCYRAINIISDTAKMVFNPSKNETGHGGQVGDRRPAHIVAARWSLGRLGRRRKEERERSSDDLNDASQFVHH